MSFLQNASAKIIADKLLNKQANYPANETLRLLLVEEECEANNASCYGNENLTRSLAFDFAYSVVSSSPLRCRGCYNHSASSIDAIDDLSVGCVTTEIPSRRVCSCCKVALLLPGEPNSTTKKRRRSESKSNCRGNSKFPTCFVRKGVDGVERLDPTLLGQIQIKYVTSLAEVIQFLSYATSLPDHLQPLDGIFLLGLSKILTRQNINMELTHLLSMLSDTADALEEKGMTELTSFQSFEFSEPHRRCSIVATIETSAYSLIHQNVVKYLHHWVDFTYFIRPLQVVTPDEQSSEWELVHKNTAVIETLSDALRTPTGHEISLRFVVKTIENKSEDDYYEPMREISWKE